MRFRSEEQDFSSQDFDSSSSGQQRHAATLEQGQREVRSILGALVLSQLRSVWHAQAAQVQGEQVGRAERRVSLSVFLESEESSRASRGSAESSARYVSLKVMHRGEIFAMPRHHKRESGAAGQSCVCVITREKSFCILVAVVVTQR